MWMSKFVSKNVEHFQQQRSYLNNTLCKYCLLFMKKQFDIEFGKAAQAFQKLPLSIIKSYNLAWFIFSQTKTKKHRGKICAINDAVIRGCCVLGQQFWRIVINKPQQSLKTYSSISAWSRSKFDEAIFRQCSKITSSCAIIYFQNNLKIIIYVRNLITLKLINVSHLKGGIITKT